MNSFLILIGATLTLMTVMAAWAFKSSSAPLWAKVLLPLTIVAASCVAPIALNLTAGCPVSITFEQLPGCFDLMAFSANDEEKRVSIWIIEGKSTRAYELPIDRRVVSGLKIFMEEGQPGVSLRLCKNAKPEKENYEDAVHGGEAMNGSDGLVIDPSTQAPKKDQQ